MVISEISSIKNLRDLGGIATKDGRKVRQRCLLRSANLGAATEEDMLYLQQEYRLRTVIDLRTEQERMELPDYVGTLNYLTIPIIESFEAGITHEASVEGMPFPDLRELYKRMMLNIGCQANFRKVLKTFFDNDFGTGAVLWHCTEGKDRCGMTAALLLEALGVDRENILQDYLETNTTNLPKAQKIYEEMCKKLDEKTAVCIYQAYIADKTYIENAWAVMGTHYLTDTLGFTEQELEAFREQVLE